MFFGIGSHHSLFVRCFNACLIPTDDSFDHSFLRVEPNGPTNDAKRSQYDSNDASIYGNNGKQPGNAPTSDTANAGPRRSGPNGAGDAHGKRHAGHGWNAECSASPSFVIVAATSASSSTAERSRTNRRGNDCRGDSAFAPRQLIHFVHVPAVR